MSTPTLSTPLRRRPRLTLRARVLLWRCRWLVVAICLGLAISTVVERVSPADTRPVAVAAHGLELGAVLAAADVRIAALPRDLVPDGAVATADGLVGARLAVGVPSGLPLVESVLVEEFTAAPGGTVIAPVRFADAAVAALLRPGMRVDVAASGELGSAARRVATDALVLALQSAADDDAGGDDGLFGSTGPSAADAPVLLAVTPDEALALSGVLGQESLSAVIVG